MKMTIPRPLKIAIAVLLSLIVLSQVDIHNLASLLASADPMAAALTMFFTLCNFALGAFNLWLLLNAIHSIPFRYFLECYVYSYCVALFAPGQLGDASLGLFLKSKGIPLSRSAAVYGIDKVLTAFFLLAVGAAGAVMLLGGSAEISWPRLLTLSATGVGALALAVAVLLRCDFVATVRIRLFVKDAWKELSVFSTCKRRILWNACLTIFKWVLMSSAFYFGFRSFGACVEWPLIGVIPILSTLVGYIPISLAGIGTVEITAVYLFSLIGVDSTTVVAVYLFIRMLIYLQAGCMMLVIQLKRRGKQPDGQE